MFKKKHKDTLSASASTPALRERRSSGYSSLSDMTEHERVVVNMERTMDEEVAKVLSHWDDSNQNSTRSLRPDTLDVNGAHSSGRRSPFLLHSPKPPLRRLQIESLRPRSSSSMPVSMCFDTESISSAHSVNDTSSESLDEDSRRSLYTIDPMTGRKLFRIHFDVQGYSRDDVRVKVTGHKLVIFAMKRENKSGRKSTSEFCRKLKVPEDVDVDKLESSILNGVLCIEGPVMPKRSRSETSSPIVDMPLDKALYNVPQIKDTERGKVLKLLVEIGPLFKNDDIVVQLKGTHRLIIRAERRENNMHGSMSANLQREFILPKSIRPPTLKAGLATSGVLSLTANINESKGSTSGSGSGNSVTASISSSEAEGVKMEEGTSSQSLEKSH